MRQAVFMQLSIDVRVDTVRLFAPGSTFWWQTHWFGGSCVMCASHMPLSTTQALTHTCTHACARALSLSVAFYTVSRFFLPTHPLNLSLYSRMLLRFKFQVT